MLTLDEIEGCLEASLLPANRAGNSIGERLGLSRRLGRLVLEFLVGQARGALQSPMIDHYTEEPNPNPNPVEMPCLAENEGPWTRLTVRQRMAIEAILGERSGGGKPHDEQR